MKYMKKERYAHVIIELKLSCEKVSIYNVKQMNISLESKSKIEQMINDILGHTCEKLILHVWSDFQSIKSILFDKIINIIKNEIDKALKPAYKLNGQEITITDIKIPDNYYFSLTKIILDKYPEEIDLGNRLTGFIYFYGLEKLISHPELEIDTDIFIEFLKWPNFREFYPKLLTIIDESKSINRFYCIEIVLDCLEINDLDLKDETIKLLSKILDPFNVDLYFEFDKKIDNINENIDQPCKQLCAYIICDNIQVDSKFDFNFKLFESSIEYIENFFDRIIEENNECSCDYDVKVFFCISIYIVFGFIPESSDLTNSFEVIDLFNKTIQKCESLKKISEPNDDIDIVKSKIANYFFGKST